MQIAKRCVPLQTEFATHFIGMRKQEEIIEDLKKFSPTRDGDWSDFVKLLDELWTTKNPQRAYRTLFELLVKYDGDYMECQWDIIHGMEHFGEYESELVDSLTIKPVDLTLTMLSRLINSGRKQIASTSIEMLLEQILDRADSNEELSRLAQDCKTRLKTTEKAK
jgi:hypothetical protein